jgi:hypothetical protein
MTADGLSGDNATTLQEAQAFAEGRFLEGATRATASSVSSEFLDAYTFAFASMQGMAPRPATPRFCRCCPFVQQ